MDNKKRTVHSSGPLGRLMEAGQIKKVDFEETVTSDLTHVGLEEINATGPYFKTQAGLKFSENELIQISPVECEPWEYANRSTDEMGDIEELMLSIKNSSQLQPVLVRLHPHPHDNIKYQVIFGRRRLEACKRLNIQLLAILKDQISNQEAIACQDAENKMRANVSNYSNAILYKKLLEDKMFASPQELANKLNISKSSLSELMSYTKIPQDIINEIPDIHSLPVYMSLKINSLINQDSNNKVKIRAIANQIGKAINTPARLEAVVNTKQSVSNVPYGTKKVCEHQGKKLFTFNIDHKGAPTIRFEKQVFQVTDIDSFMEKLKQLVVENSNVRTSEQ